MPPSSSEFVDLARAVAALQRGEFILVYDGDGREEETDLTIARFAAMAKEATKRENGWAAHVFAEEFRSPGHVPLLNAVDPLLVERRGHTELTTALMLMAGLAPTATICEMMADDGRALSKQDAKAYARARNLGFLEGQDIVRAWRSWSV